MPSPRCGFVMLLSETAQSMAIPPGMHPGLPLGDEPVQTPVPGPLVECILTKI
jgi:hypothetical protein